jgi:hypothetical protein
MLCCDYAISPGLGLGLNRFTFSLLSDNSSSITSIPQV